jgi:hypothetical protein
MAGLLRRKAKSRIVFLVSQNNNDTFSLAAEFGQTMTDKFAAYAVALMLWQHGHWSQRNGSEGPLCGFDHHSAEENMASDLSINLGDKR